ncbi:MAG: cupin domain-containing protein [Planctomycetes bacterium]|nr:cupin domain-containing protein [Planctomycetota bacterium]
MHTNAVTLDGIQFPPATGCPMRGAEVLQAILSMANQAIDRLRSQSARPIAAVGRLRGTGRGVHFRDLIHTLEAEHPITLTAPFEDSALVAGAAWDAAQVIGVHASGALAKLQWCAGADDLPMHVHEHSDRFIIVHEGRGFFHVSDQTVGAFDGSDVRSIPARERDVFLFTRGVVHTFSTLDEPMTLLSCQVPYLAFDDPRQYRLPPFRWIARDQPERRPPRVACDPAWSVLAIQAV